MAAHESIKDEDLLPKIANSPSKSYMSKPKLEILIKNKYLPVKVFDERSSSPVARK